MSVDMCIVEVVVASKECTAHLHDVETGSCEQVFRGHFGWVHTATSLKQAGILQIFAHNFTEAFESLIEPCFAGVSEARFCPKGKPLVL